MTVRKRPLAEAANKVYGIITLIIVKVGIIYKI